MCRRDFVDIMGICNGMSEYRGTFNAPFIEQRRDLTLAHAFHVILDEVH